MKRLAAVALLLASQWAAAATIYQCNKNGQKVFQDQPCATSADGDAKVVAPPTQGSADAARDSVNRYGTRVDRQLYDQAQYAQMQAQAQALRAQMQARYDESRQRWARGGAPAPQVSATSVPPPRNWADGAEIALVTGQEPEANGSQRVSRQGPAPVVEVTVARPGKAVLLVLSSRKAVSWHVSSSADTRLAGVVYMADADDGASSINTAAPVARVQLGYSTKPEGSALLAMLQQLERWYGTRKVDMLLATSAIPAHVRLDQPKTDPEWSLDGAPVVAASRPLRFTLPALEGKAVDWTLAGPVGGRYKGYLAEGKRIYPATGNFNFAIANQGHGRDCLALLVKKTGEPALATLPASFPECDRAADLALDTRRNILTLITRGGSGTLYRYDVAQRRWLDYVSLQNHDATALAYDPVGDRYFAWTSLGEMLVLSANGVVQGGEAVASRLTSFSRLTAPGKISVPRVDLAPAGDDVAVVGYAGNDVRYVWQYNVGNHAGRLTYKAPQSL